MSAPRDVGSMVSSGLDARAILPELIALRRSLHREPEIGLDLPKTQAKVLSALSGLPLEISTGQGLSSVVAVLRGARPGPTVLLRADMDALRIDEETGLEFASTVPGAMHSCGHDLHTTWLVGAARLLAARREQLAGNVILMFQPGEEYDDGAGLMLAEGVLGAAGDQPVAAYALHAVVVPLAKPDAVLIRSGAMMMGSDSFVVTVVGAERTSGAPFGQKDPFPVACEIVTAAQDLVKAIAIAGEPLMLNIWSVSKPNTGAVSRERVELKGSMKTMSRATQERMRAEFRLLCERTASAHGLTSEFAYRLCYPVTVNDANETARAARVVEQVLGPGRLHWLDQPTPSSEDFSRVLQAIPGVYLAVQAVPSGERPGWDRMNHSPRVVFDERVLADGTELLAALAIDRLRVADASGSTPAAR